MLPSTSIIRRHHLTLSPSPHLALRRLIHHRSQVFLFNLPVFSSTRPAGIPNPASSPSAIIRFQPLIGVGRVRTISTGIDSGMSSISSASTASSRSESSAVQKGRCELDIGVELWTGQAVFVSTPYVPGYRSVAAQSILSSRESLLKCNRGSQAASCIQPTGHFTPPRGSTAGTAASPISVTSSPTTSPPPALPRPRAVPHYSSPISRTAYTLPSRQNSSPAGTKPHAPVHPFFNRDFTRSRSTPLPAPSASQRPRMVADYSSTSDSASVYASQETRGTESTWGSQRVESPSPSLKGKDTAGGGLAERQALSEREMEEIIQQVASVDLTGKIRANPLDGATTKGKGKDVAPAIRPTGKATYPSLSSSGSANSKWTSKNGPNSLKGLDKEIAARSGAAPTARKGMAVNAVPQQATGKAVPASKTGQSTLGRYGRKPTIASSSGASANHTCTTAPNPSQVHIGPSKPTRSTSPVATPVQPQKPPSTNLSKPAKPTKTAKPTAPISSAPFFDYRQHTPSAPHVAYTTSLSEADDLLSCLKGPVLGMDLEWPVSGIQKLVDPRTGTVRRKAVGGTWDDEKKKYIWGQGRTALIQVCDERLIVLIHLKEGQSELHL